MTIFNNIASGEVIDTDHLVVLIGEMRGSRREALEHGLLFEHHKVIVVRNQYEMASQLKKEKVDLIILNMQLAVTKELSEIDNNNINVLEVILAHKKNNGGFPYVIGLLPTELLYKGNLLMSIGIDEIIPLPVSTVDIVQGIQRFSKRLSFCDKGVRVPIEENGIPSVWIKG